MSVAHIALMTGQYGGVVWTPASLFTGGEKGAWYDPSDFSTLYQDSAGTTPVTAAGQPVGKMLDKSGNGYHLTQSTSTARPTVEQDGGGKWYLHPDGVDDYMVCASFVLTGADVYVAAGIKSGASASNYERVLTAATNTSTVDSGSVATSCLLLRDGTNNSFSSYRASSLGAAVSLALSTKAVLETGQYATGSYAAINGGSEATLSRGALGDLNIGAVKLFAAMTSPEMSKCDFYGGIILDRLPTSGERSSIVTYTNGKTGAF